MSRIQAILSRAFGVIGKRGVASSGGAALRDDSSASSRLTSSLVRALLVIALAITPSVMLSDGTSDTKQMVALLALFGGVLTFVEYHARYPVLIEFRDSPPFNRMRFLMLFLTVFLLSIIERGKLHPSALSELVEAVGRVIGVAMDFPYSPVRLATMMLSDATSKTHLEAIRVGTGMAYLISLISLSVFVVLLKAGSWPRREIPFNVWINLPTFDPTHGGDVAERLTRDARANITFGFLLPFVSPAVVKIAAQGLEPLVLSSPQTFVWTITLWAFLPVSLFMRGIAMSRVAQMLRETRRANDSGEDPGEKLAAA